MISSFVLITRFLSYRVESVPVLVSKTCITSQPGSFLSAITELLNDCWVRRRFLFPSSVSELEVSCKFSPMSSCSWWSIFPSSSLPLSSSLSYRPKVSRCLLTTFSEYIDWNLQIVHGHGRPFRLFFLAMRDFSLKCCFEYGMSTQAYRAMSDDQWSIHGASACFSTYARLTWQRFYHLWVITGS